MRRYKTVTEQFFCILALTGGEYGEKEADASYSINTLTCRDRGKH